MSNRTGSYVGLVARSSGGWFAHVVDDEQTAFAAIGGAEHAAVGDVFFDHVRGVLDPAPAACVDTDPYLLVAEYRDFDWTAQHSVHVKPFADVAALVDEAAQLVAAEKQGASWNVELWEVYGVRVRERWPRIPRPRRAVDALGRLLEDIRNAPDDDEPRLVWADAVGGERGELVVLQTQLARGGLPPRETIARRKRQRDLLANHGRAWSGLDGIARRVSFHRGFVDAADIPVATLLASSDVVAERAPLLTSLTASELGDNAIAAISRLVADPLVRGLDGLDFAGQPLVPDELAVLGRLDESMYWLVTAGILRRLRALGLGATNDPERARVVLGHDTNHAIERLALGAALDAERLSVLLRSPGIASVRALAFAADLFELTAPLPPQLTELRIAARAALSLENVMHPGVERLAVSATSIVELHRLSALPRLRALELRGGVNASALVTIATSLPELRELALDAPLARDGLLAIAKAYGPQLELLDVRGNHHALRYVNELKPHVAGELLVGNGSERPLLRTGPTTQMAWWDHVML